MTDRDLNDAPVSVRTARSIGLSLLPIAIMGVVVVAGLLYALTVPDSSPPSADNVLRAVILFCVVAVLLLVASAAFVSARAGRLVWVVASGFAVALAVAGWNVSRSLDAAWSDACNFGTGSGDRCAEGTAGAPVWALLMWPAFGIAVAVTCGAVADLARRAGSE